MSVGLEATPGTPVAATRRMYGKKPVETVNINVQDHHFETGTRDNLRRHTGRAIEAGGNFPQPVSAEESIELFLATVQGAVSPTIPTNGILTRDWTFKPSGTVAQPLDSQTYEWQDGANPWREFGVLGDNLQIRGSAAGDNEITMGMFGVGLAANAMTAGLAERVPTLFDGWQAQFYIDPIGAVPGTTLVPGTLVNWDIKISNGLARKYTADNTRNALKIPIGELDVSCTATIEASSATALAEFADYLAITGRTLRFAFGLNDLIEAVTPNYYRTIFIDIPGVWKMWPLNGEDAKTRVYALQYSYEYEPVTLASGLQVICRNSRTTAYGLTTNTAALTGTLTAGHAAADIVTGGKTIILTLTGTTWATAGAAFNAQRQAIINGLVANSAQANGWNNTVIPAMAQIDVVRTSGTVVTITLPPVAAYAIASNEVLTAIIPATATAAGVAIAATPTVTINP